MSLPILDRYLMACYWNINIETSALTMVILSQPQKKKKKKKKVLVTAHIFTELAILQNIIALPQIFKKNISH